MKLLNSNLVRNFVFGVEDSLVSTIGLVSGIAIVGTARSTVLLTGIILIAVEAFSMAVGTLLSDNSATEFRRRTNVSFSKSIFSSLVMFVSYIGAGILVILPYLFFDTPSAFPLSVILSMIAMFVLGVLSAIISGLPLLKKGLIMMMIGGVAIIIGIGVGSLVNMHL